MSVKTIECGECGETVPYGRLACPSCGALLAAVAGAPPPAVRVIEPEVASAEPSPSAVGSDAIDPVAATTSQETPQAGLASDLPTAPDPVAAADLATVDPATAATSETPAPVARQAKPAAAPARARRPAAIATEAAITDPEPAATITDQPAATAESPEPLPADIPSTSPAPVPVGFLLEPATDAPPPSSYLLDNDDGVDPPVDELDSPWPPLLKSEPAIVARPYGWSGTPGVAGTAAAPPVPGAYLPPSSAPAPAPAMAAMTAGPLAAAAVPAAPSVSETAAAARLRISDAFVGIDRPRLVEISGWFVIVGSAMSILGFFLPWSMVVIGANGTGGYLDDWGLASPTHLFVLVGLLIVLGLGVVETGAPDWLRTGVLGLTFGGLLLGLLWPYAVGPLGADFGAMVTVLGAVAMLIGGGVASWATRHVEPPPAV